MCKKYNLKNGSEYMDLFPDGAIARPAIGMQASDSWRVIGAVERNNFGRVVKRYSLADILKNPSSVPWEFKNGKQRTFILDLDHGTVREWRSPKHHIS